MSVQLLDKTRKINKLLHNNNSSKVVFNDICAVLTEILKCFGREQEREDPRREQMCVRCMHRRAARRVCRFSY